MGQVAPHADRNELAMVIAGEKPMAAIERGKDEAMFVAIDAELDTGGVVGYVWLNPDYEWEAVVALPENWQLLKEYRRLLLTGVQDYGIKEHHRRMGRLFGYTESDVEAFISAEIQCDCAKCTGG